jgi:hypothetical protein
MHDDERPATGTGQARNDNGVAANRLDRAVQAKRGAVGRHAGRWRRGYGAQRQNNDAGSDGPHGGILDDFDEEMDWFRLNGFVDSSACFLEHLPRTNWWTHLDA